MPNQSLSTRSIVDGLSVMHGPDGDHSCYIQPHYTCLSPCLPPTVCVLVIQCIGSGLEVGQADTGSRVLVVSVAGGVLSLAKTEEVTKASMKIDVSWIMITRGIGIRLGYADFASKEGFLQVWPSVPTSILTLSKSVRAPNAARVFWSKVKGVP
jgi:hypothetical protein